MSKKQIVLVVAPDWTRARKYLEASKQAVHISVAFRVLVGKEIESLRSKYQVQHGKSSNSFHGERSWSEAVQKELDISESTAWRFHEMWKAAKPRIKKLGKDEEIFARLVEKPFSEMTKAETELLESTTRKLTDGQTEKQLMLDWGITKNEQGSGATGGKRSRKGPKPSAEEVAKMAAEYSEDRALAMIQDMGVFFDAGHAGRCTKDVRQHVIDACESTAKKLKEIK